MHLYLRSVHVGKNEVFPNFGQLIFYADKFKVGSLKLNIYWKTWVYHTHVFKLLIDSFIYTSSQAPLCKNDVQKKGERLAHCCANQPKFAAKLYERFYSILSHAQSNQALVIFVIQSCNKITLSGTWTELFQPRSTTINLFFSTTKIILIKTSFAVAGLLEITLPYGSTPCGFFPRHWVVTAFENCDKRDLSGEMIKLFHLSSSVLHKILPNGLPRKKFDIFNIVQPSTISIVQILLDNRR